MTLLVEATDADFAWMLGEAGAPASLHLPPGGVDAPFVLKWIRRTLAEMGPGTCWMMVDDGEVVGVCSLKSPTEADGFIEIGYGVVEAHRRRGHATRSVAELVERASRMPGIHGLWASTAADNEPSQRVLVANDFVEAGRAVHLEEGELVLWRLRLQGSCSRVRGSRRPSASSPNSAFYGKQKSEARRASRNTRRA
jgi:RimJ/RimL family protein N-acetyltransferase